MKKAEREKLEMVVRAGILIFCDGVASVKPELPTYKMVTMLTARDRDAALRSGVYTSLHTTLGNVLGANDVSGSLIDTASGADFKAVLVGEKALKPVSLDEYIAFLADADYCLFALGETIVASMIYGKLLDDKLNMTTSTYMLLLSNIVGVSLYGDYGCVKVIKELRESLEKTLSNKFLGVDLNNVDFRNAIRA